MAVAVAVAVAVARGSRVDVARCTACDDDPAACWFRLVVGRLLRGAAAAGVSECDTGGAALRSLVWKVCAGVPAAAAGGDLNQLVAIMPTPPTTTANTPARINATGPLTRRA